MFVKVSLLVILSQASLLIYLAQKRGLFSPDILLPDGSTETATSMTVEILRKGQMLWQVNNDITVNYINSES